MRILLLISLALFFTACGGGGGSSGSASPVAVTPITDPDNRNTPHPEDPSVEQFSVFRNYGWAGEILALDFSTLRLNQTKFIQWYQYEAGQFLVEGREYRRCRADFTISGTEDVGIITISGSFIGWSYDPNESVYFHSCPGNVDGVYYYMVDGDGLHLTKDGVETVYPEVL